MWLGVYVCGCGCMYVMSGRALVSGGVWDVVQNELRESLTVRLDNVDKSY